MKSNAMKYVGYCNWQLKHGTFEKAKQLFDLAWKAANENGPDDPAWGALYWMRDNFYNPNWNKTLPVMIVKRDAKEYFG